MLVHVIAILCTVVLHVDCNSKGKASDGSLNKPFKSVEEVCSKLYSYQEDVVVKFHNGIYEIKEDIELNDVNNVVFESVEKNKPALFTKSVKIGKDMIVDSEWRPLVCYNDEFATLARWPNKGFVKFKETDNEKSFKYTCTKFNKINFEKEEAYVCGYLAAEWQFDVRRIKSYKNSVVELDNMPKAPTEWKGPGRGRFYVCNLKSELDSPGEYYWDSKTKVVSFVKPKERIRDLRACVNKTIIILQGCSNVIVRNINFQYSQRDGIRLFDCKNCIVDSCSFKTIRENGIFIKGGNSCLVTNSVVYNAGSSGVLITSAGDRKKLIGCNHVVTNCKIDRIGFSDTTYVNCIRANGVGICIRNVELVLMIGG